ncbi:MAG: hypothetical protein NTU84_04655, partial [Verrucomicrobia bacterium]|nr:hypothetical protein [Verrucomicrobiota bacterium]
TRAQDQLTKTYCSKRVKWGQENACQDRSFIGELDDAHLEQTSYEEVLAYEPDSEELSNFFSNLKNMLGSDQQ